MAAKEPQGSTTAPHAIAEAVYHSFRSDIPQCETIAVDKGQANVAKAINMDPSSSNGASTTVPPHSPAVGSCMKASFVLVLHNAIESFSFVQYNGLH